MKLTGYKAFSVLGGKVGQGSQRCNGEVVTVIYGDFVTV